MSHAAELKRVSQATMRFMRGRYVMDEIGNDKNTLKFRRGERTLLTIVTHDDHYTFVVIFGKAERDTFTTQRDSFSTWMQAQYDHAKVHHEGRWMYIDVSTMAQLEEVKRMIIIKKKPNRKPFPTEQAQLSRCGMRCYLCVHYTGGTISESLRAVLAASCNRCYGGGFDEPLMRCAAGCQSKSMDDPCGIIQCLKGRQLTQCHQCPEFPCDKAPLVRCEIDPHSTTAEDITLAVLPYVHEQYGN